MTFAATARTLRYALFTAAAVASAAVAWGQAMERTAAAATVTEAAAPPATHIGAPKADRATEQVAGDDTAHRRLMLLMLINRVREVGPFGRLGQ